MTVLCSSLVLNYLLDMLAGQKLQMSSLSIAL